MTGGLRAFAAAGCILLASISFAAWKAPARAASKPNPFPADDKSLKLGKAAYVKECQDCHGDRGKGDGPAAKDLVEGIPDITAEKILKQTDGELFWKITTGRKPMPAMEKTLSEDDRWHVVNYMRTLAKGK